MIFLGDLAYPAEDSVRLDFDNALFDDRLVVANLEGGIGVSDLPVKVPTNFQLFSHAEQYGDGFILYSIGNVGR